MLEYFKIFFVTILVLSLVYLLLFKFSLRKSEIAIIISILALVVSICGVFKNEIFSFHLKVYARDRLIPATKSPNVHYSFPIVLPIHFINQGYGEGIIEDVVLLIKGEKDTGIKYFVPIAEIDMKDFIQEKMKLDQGNIENAFHGFILTGKSSTIKNILFLQSPNSKKYPFSGWKIGSYTIEVHIKTAKSEKYKRYSMIPFEVNTKTVDSYNKGTSVYTQGNRSFVD